ncbi:DNA methyltransferase [Streptomyces sp. S.PB5]|uniref:Eco57I restriction-modification methylase domain-containing protein n=1 Tax=Streptomyces sp. S.PB5 TaxID=3020844 RepID=UPI0025AF9083|nr:DNA methyltransferase [Streptomyces sp. S.PB5]MDN3020606.1 class I SAM-dependent DNA methyltransferase [Streptomyces sp. S.PB5]
MKFDALINEGEYFPSFYLDEILPKQLKSGRLKEWAAEERQGRPTPRQGLRDLTGPYLDVRLTVGGEAEKFNVLPDPGAVAAQQTAVEALKAHSGAEEPPAFQPCGPREYGDSPEDVWRAGLDAWHARVLRALGFTPNPGHLTVHGAAGPVAVPVAHHEPGVAVLTGGFAYDIAGTRAEGSANRLPAPVRVASGKTLTTVTDLAAWLLADPAAPRYALLLFGGVMVLADRENYARGRHLAVSLEVALPRKGVKGASAGELEVIAALFGAPSLRPAEDGGDDDIARLVSESRDHSVGVTSDLREGLKKSVQLIANEVLQLARDEGGVQPDDLPEWLPETLTDPNALPRVLTKESLRYLYRILFLLYAEARPELDILPMKSEEYVEGYSVARLRELVVQEKLSSASRDRHHFHDSLALLFEKVFTGHPVADTITSREALRSDETEREPETAVLAEDDGYEGVRIEALKSRLFDPKSIKLVDQVITHPDDPARRLDLRLRNKVLHQVLRNLTVVEGRGRGGRGGFISYANLSINHLGAVYEGLMSYTGFVADEPLYEVAKGGDPSGGSWLIKASQVASGRYPDGPDDSVFVATEVNPQTNERVPVPRKVGSYVYRLAGRDRQTSASYYTPESLTQATVEQTLRFRLDEKGEVDPKEPESAWVNAADVLRWRVCEPALGSGAFLNEAVNQLAELYLRLAQRERGVEIDPEDYQRELQKVKAYIALHNAYGVDLNETAVELAEISLWLNTMYQGMKAPWYGLHLHRGNSLIGAARKVYPGNLLHKGDWLTTKDPRRPRHVPLGEKLKAREVHQFLLPAMGWGSIGEKVGLRTLKKGTPEETVKAVVDGDVVDWLEPELVEAMRKWRSAMRRNPKGGPPKKESGSKQKAALTPEELAEKDAQLGQGAFDLGLGIYEQETLEEAFGGADSGAGAGSASGSGSGSARAVVSSADEDWDPKGTTQTGRLIRLARRVEYLWDLVVMRLTLSEQEISRQVDVWGAAAPRDGQGGRGSMDRDAVLAALQRKGTPYWRLKQVMDAWCALWFWPLEDVGLLDGSDDFEYRPHGEDRTALRKDDPRRTVPLRSLEDWLEFAEAVVGRVDVDTGEGEQGSFLSFEGVKNLGELDDKERELDQKMIETLAWARPAELGSTFPWYGKVVRIAEERGFFHWELDFAHVFSEGGFDLMVGNPPWVKQEWKESGVLAEFEPWFELAEKPSNEAWDERKADVMGWPGARSAFMGELADHAAMAGFLASVDTYPELVGTQPDLYRAFMLLGWRAVGERGTAGLIHPSTHLTGPKEGVLRKQAYAHLRLHADFVNELYLFAKPVDHSTHFSLNVYGKEQDICFQHMSWLLHPSVLVKSVRHDGAGPVPGVKEAGKWDLRPHQKRIVPVGEARLTKWRALAGEQNPPPVEQTKLLFPVTVSEDSAIAALAKWPHRLAALSPRISRGFDEKNDRTAGYFTWDSGPADTWNDVILQGPFIGLATPFAKRPVDGARTSLQTEPWDHLTLAVDAVPRTNYRRSVNCSVSEYYAGLGRRSWTDGELLDALRSDEQVADVLRELADDEDERRALLGRWATRPYSRFYRLAWRRQIASNTERSLFAALIPPGPAHVHMMHSAALATSRETALVAGFWASLPLDYFLRATGRSDLQKGEAEVMPAPTADHPLEQALLLRTLRLNCQTNAYAPLWDELYDPTWQQDTWAASTTWPDATPLLTEGVTDTWTGNTPLRTEFTRRAALVEIDALVAVWLGISADELVAMYDARFPVLQQYEENMWFDATGRRIAKAHQQHGYGQPKDAWKELSSHEDFPETANVPSGYTGPLYRADRKKEMRAAHAEFTRRLNEAG